MSEESQLKVFTKILSFVNEYKTAFPNESIALYYKLLKKTEVSNTNAINKHIEVFSTWLNKNREAVLKKKVEDIKEPLAFSAKVFLPLHESLQKADNETRNSIFKHLQVIYYRISPDDELRSVLELSIKEGENIGISGKEGDFLNKFMNKIENSFGSEEFKDPMQATSAMISSGLFTELYQDLNSGLNSGQLDVQQLLNSVQGMMGNLTGGSANGMPDISGLMSGVMGMMGGMNLGGMNLGEQNNNQEPPNSLL
jgi:hypothetical protein